MLLLDSDGSFDPTMDLILEIIFGIWTVEHQEGGE
jgi:hypothetical protein